MMPMHVRPDLGWPVAALQRPLARAERDLELLAQEQALEHKVVALMEDGGRGGEEDAE